MDQDKEEQLHRIYNRKKSNSAKQAWKKHHYNYMRGNRKKSRDNMRSFTAEVRGESMDIKELNDKLSKILNESKIEKDNVFDLKTDILLENIAGGISFSIDKKTGVTSFSTYMSQEGGKGAYKVINDESVDLNVLYDDLKDELLTLSKTIDDSMKQILAKHGLKATE